MKFWFASFLILASFSAQAAAPLTQVAESHWQWTGIAVTDNHDVFVNFPLWSDRREFAVGKLDANHNPAPWPDRDWNSWKMGDKLVKGRFICVQSVVRDDKNNIWVLDAGNPFFKGVIDGAARLMKFDPQSGKLLWSHTFDKPVIEKKSYLNDVRFDKKNGFAFITDSGAGTLIALNLKTDQAMRMLAIDKSTHAEDIQTVVDGKVQLQKGKPAKMHADSIAYDAQKDVLYYKALTARPLYSIPGSSLRDFSLNDEQRAKTVKQIAMVGPTDGFAMDDRENLYLTPVEQKSITVMDKDGHMSTLVSGDEVAWPDSLSITKDGQLYFTTSRLHENDAPTEAYKVFRVDLKK